jgi:hypothetical protein
LRAPATDIDVHALGMVLSRYKSAPDLGASG